MVTARTTKATRTTRTTKKAITSTATSNTTAAAEIGTNEKYEEIKKGDMHITALQKMTIKALQDSAKKEGIKEYSGLKKQELIFKILKERVNQNGLMYGEGVVEVLPEGFGFLRSPD
jgi:transcription termination factor Rho